MTRRNKHPSAQQLASMAVGGERSRRGERVRAHVARCEQCTRACQQLDAIRTILAGVSYPPMPDNLSARIDSAISREARRRQAAMPAGEAGRRDPSAGRAGALTGGGWHMLDLLASVTRLTVAASAVVIAVAGSYLVAENAGTSVMASLSSPLAGAAAPRQQMTPGPEVTYGQPGSLDTIRAVKSHTNFVAAHLRAEAISAVNAAGARQAFSAQPSSNATALLLTDIGENPSADSPTESRLAGCTGLISHGKTVLLVDVARYEGKPATVIVTAAAVGKGAEAWVVGPSCSATSKDVLKHAALGRL
ncbi:MAG TPA: hypothetical protein VMA72_23060 [Streptosporangiaceae bacterium]|nr:hypothetical protein [Streptosporangiaceae bacterium]